MFNSFYKFDWQNLACIGRVHRQKSQLAYLATQQTLLTASLNVAIVLLFSS